MPQYPIGALGPGTKRIEADFVGNVEPREEHARQTNAQAEEIGQSIPALANDMPDGDFEKVVKDG